MKMKIYAIGIVAIILIVACYYIFIGVSGTVLEDENEAGAWGVSAEVKYADGTTETLNSGVSSLGVQINDKEVQEITFAFMSKMYGVGYERGEIDLTDVDIVAKIITDNTINYRETVDSLGVVAIPVDNQWHLIARQTITASFIEIHTPPEPIPDGSGGWDYSHILEISLTGTAQYRGLPNGEYYPLTLPRPVRIMYERFPNPISADPVIGKIYCDTRFDWK